MNSLGTEQSQMESLQRPWFRFYDEDVPRTLTYDPVAIPDFLRTSARRFPRRDALVFLGRHITYAQLHRMVERMAYALYQLGVRKGDRVAIMLPNCPQTVIAYYAALSIGAVAVLTNPLYMERELKHQWGESGAETVVVLDMLWPRVAAVRAELPLKRIIVTSIQDFLPFPKNILLTLQLRRQGKHVSIPYTQDIIPFRTLLAHADNLPSPITLSPDDLACIQFTGGTTGLPKGAMLTHRNLVASVHQIRAFLLQGHTEGQDRVVGVLPFFHVYGMNGVMNLGIHLAATIVLLPRLDLKMLVKAIRDERPTFFLGVPTLFAALNRYLGIEHIDFTSVQGCFSGGASLPVEIIRSFEAKTGARITEAYGLSETSSVTHVNPRRGLRKYGSVGVPIVGTDAKIMDMETGTRELPPGEVGELWIKGPQVMIGYWNDPEETAQTLVDGWLRTGDLAYMDEDGYFYIVDRKKDLIVTSSLNVCPREVEDVLRQHPKVYDAAVIGLPDALRGEKVVACVVLKPGEQATAAELREHCRTQLAPYKVPRAVYFRKSLPLSPTGKVLRRVLREEILAHQHDTSRSQDN